MKGGSGFLRVASWSSDGKHPPHHNTCVVVPRYSLSTRLLRAESAETNVEKQYYLSAHICYLYICVHIDSCHGPVHHVLQNNMMSRGPLLGRQTCLL